jgi:hypothetical protein
MSRLIARGHSAAGRTRENTACVRGLTALQASQTSRERALVANKEQQPTDAVCCFRVNGSHPELWSPETGRVERAAVYDEADGRG